MSLQVEKLEGNMARLTIEVSAEEFEKSIEKAYQRNRGRVSIPGFRKGKVPRRIIEQMYGKNVFCEDAANDLVPVAYAQALDECTEDIVSQPSITVERAEAGQPFVFTAEVALKPDVALGKYKGIEYEKADITVTDEEVEEAVENERESNARLISVEDRAVQDGDIVVVDFEGFMDGVAFEGGKGENYSLTIGSGNFVPGFEEQLIGAEINKETEVSITFPEDYQAEELAGKPAVFKCVVKEIKEKELPELDDEFASDVSEFDTLAEYREDVKKHLEEMKKEEAENEKQEKVVEAVIKDAQMEIPEAMLTTQQRQMADDFARRIRRQGLTLDQYFQVTGLTREAFFEQIKPQAEQRIKLRLAFEAVARAEGIEVSDEEFEEELKKMAEDYKVKVDELTEMLGKFEQKAVREDLCIQKAIDFVMENAVGI